ncbi:hypothetical protein MNBD_NITROSPINAE02-2073, partial [hydrothermal vent metagenome]
LANAGLAEPAGQSQNDLVTILTGTPELSQEVTPLTCPLDVVTREGEYADDDCPWGELLRGRYTLNQWGSLPGKLIGDWKPAVFGDDVLVEGIALNDPVRVGMVTGPGSLFDSATGSSTLNITFPKGGVNNSSNPFPAPCDIYIGDWKFTIQKEPKKLQSGDWEYEIYGPTANELHYVPTPLKNSTPMFTPASGLVWPKSADTDYGPYASAEPATGTPYQLFHGGADAGSAKDGHNPGWNGPYIKNVYVDGVEALSNEMVKDDAYGIVWLDKDKSHIAGKVGNPQSLRVKWTGVDTSFVKGDTWLRADQLTASYPYGYQAGANPCILGDFAIPASGGGAPASSRLGLVNNVRYPYLGARVAAVRFIMKYTGLETWPGAFNIKLFDTDYSFASSELGDGSGIKSAGWSVAKNQKGVQWEVWPNNNGYPYTGTSPDPRYWDIYELSRDVTPSALAHLKQMGGFADRLAIWFSGTSWPDVNSFIALSVELEITFEPVEAILGGSRVTALIGASASKAGEILKEVIPASDIGDGFTDSTLPDLKYRIDKGQSICRFVRSVTRESNTELRKNFTTGKWDLVKKTDTRDNLNPAPPTGGIAVINESEFMADGNGLPMIGRMRSAPEKVVNEVVIRYVDEEGKQNSVTSRREGSIETYGVRRYETDSGAQMTGSDAIARALDILNANAEVNDYYQMTFPLGKALALEPNDILEVTAQMDSLSATRMRIVSVEIEPGDIARGIVAKVTLNAQRYSKVRRGYGETAYGLAPYGLGDVVEN